jgi:hypothetical protein
LIQEDKKAASRIIAGKLHQFLHDAADITGMEYFCILTHHTLACSWMQDAGEEANLQHLAWMLYHYGTQIHKLGRSTLTHGEWVERKEMTALNILHLHLTDLPIGQQTCLQQLYSKTFNSFRTNMMRHGKSFQHASVVKKEEPKVSGWFKENFKQGKLHFWGRWMYGIVLHGIR